MSKTFPNNKDHIIDELDDDYDLNLSEEEYDRLRKQTEAQLFLFAVLLARATKNKKET